jgi:hypothetical protein
VFGRMRMLRRCWPLLRRRSGNNGRWDECPTAFFGRRRQEGRGPVHARRHCVRSCPMDVEGIQSRLREFAAGRDWDQFHSPKNLAMALAGEVRAVRSTRSSAGDQPAFFLPPRHPRERQCEGRARSDWRADQPEVHGHLAGDYRVNMCSLRSDADQAR